MRVGVDFDNTLVSYDDVFHREAVARGLIPPTVPATKGHVRDYLRRCDREDDWTELQGYVYGVAIRDASSFPGAIDFFVACKEQGVPAHIISHKTRHPFRGRRYDLHVAALDWLDSQGFLDNSHTGLSRDTTLFELTKQAKLERIGQLGCTHFVDDLPEFLSEPAFPEGVERILFDPNHGSPEAPEFRRATSWREITENLLSGGSATP